LRRATGRAYARDLMDEPLSTEAQALDRRHVPVVTPATPGPKRDTPESPAERLASAIGNQGMNQVVARMADGGGLLPDGTVHADVTAAIDALSGGGRRLDRQVLDRLAPTHGDLSDARVHTGPAAEQLARAVSAKAFTVGNDIFFGKGAYDPGSAQGLELVAHEAAHVVQQRGAAPGGALKATYPGDALERDADERTRAALG
jgi:hypothetical protein